jgi:hypothetical protein
MPPRRESEGPRKEHRGGHIHQTGCPSNPQSRQPLLRRTYKWRAPAHPTTAGALSPPRQFVTTTTGRCQGPQGRFCSRSRLRAAPNQTRGLGPLGTASKVCAGCNGKRGTVASELTVRIVWSLAGGKLVRVSFESTRAASGRVRPREVVSIRLRGGPRGLS